MSKEAERSQLDSPVNQKLAIVIRGGPPDLITPPAPPINVITLAAEFQSEL